MYVFIVSVMSIALLALVVASGTGLVTMDHVHKLGFASRITSDYRLLSSAHQTFVLSDRKLPDLADWRRDLAPYGLALIEGNAAGMTWSYGRDDTGSPWFCASIDAPNALLLEAMAGAQAQLANVDTFLSQACGDPALAPVLGGPVALTIGVSPGAP
jgi:hypothetical protein